TTRLFRTIRGTSGGNLAAQYTARTPGSGASEPAVDAPQCSDHLSETVPGLLAGDYPVRAGLADSGLLHVRMLLDDPLQHWLLGGFDIHEKDVIACAQAIL